MHLRRAVLLMAMVLAVVALAEAIVPVPRERRAERQPRAAPAPRPGAEARTVTLRYPPRGRTRRVRAAADAHVVVEVATSAPGDARIAGLGLVQAAEPSSPARFDILADRPGAYRVDFAPAAGRLTQVATLVVGQPGG